MLDLIESVVWVLRLVPMTLLFFVPATIGTIIWRERDAGYRFQALLWFAVGFTLLTFIHVVFVGNSVSQVAATVGLSVVEILMALVLARLTVYGLSDPPASPE